MIPKLLEQLELLLAQWLGDSIIAVIITHLISIAIVSLFVYILYHLIDKVFKRIIKNLRDFKTNKIPGLKIQNQEILSAENITGILISISRFSSIVIRFFLLLVLLNSVLGLFEITAGLASKVSGTVIGEIIDLGLALINYLPDLAVVALLIFLSIMIIRVLRLVFIGIAEKTIVIPGFYPEWAHTTLNLLKIMIIALTVVVIFPYLPGSGSPAFQGVSIFFGVLFSLGSTSVVANLVAGIVITYTRAFKIGDRVRINDTEGQVVERSNFVTRILTPKKTEVSIPNATVMNAHIINYSTQADQSGVTLHTTVTIGYDVPWRQVHELLLAAGKSTEYVEKQPQPFVLQTALDDNYVSYELNISTRRPNMMAKIYSDLHAHILDNFNQAGVEIMSPHYRAHRDGNALTIPENLVENEA